MTLSNGRQRRKGSWFPLFMLLCLSGNPILTDMDFSKALLVVYAIVFSVYMIVFKARQIHRKIIYSLVTAAGFMVLISGAQYITLGFVSLPGVIATILKVVIGVLTFVYYKDRRLNFMESYIKLMTLLTVSSFPLFALNYIGHFGFQVNAPKVKSLILYTSYDMPRELLRNSGMFWEPGAFAGYLLIALMFIAAINKAFIVGKYTKEVVVISFGVLSTLSTMGFMVYGLILFLYAMHRYKWGKIVLVPVIAVITYFGYSQLAFMSEKVSVQFEEALQMSRFDVSNTRFGSLIMDAQYISAEPLFGNGLNPATRFRFHPFINADLGHGNGMSNFMACWGVPLFAFWCFKSYKWFFVNTRSTFVSGMLLLLALLSLQGEQFLNFPLFLSFFSLADADSSI